MRIDVRAPAHVRKADKFEQDAVSVKSDALLAAIAAKSPDEIATWIDANVNDLSGAKQVIKVLTKVVALLARRL